MDKLNEVAAFLDRNPGLADCVVQITYSEMYDIAEAFRDLEQRAEAAEAEGARLTRNYKHIIEQHMPRTSDGCDKGWTRVIEARELQAKLEAAEAKLAALAKQEPVHFRPFGSDGETYVKCSPDHIDAMAFWQHPAPAADLAELVPPEADGSNLPFAANGWNACRAEMLRNIEEAKK